MDMDSANPSGGMAALLAGLLARLTGRPPTAPERVDAPEPVDAPAPPGDEAWTHGTDLDVPIPPAYEIEKMSEAEQAEFWRNWTVETERAVNSKAAAGAKPEKR